MLFTFHVDTKEQFWMYQTVMPLSIAFFDSTRRLRVVDRHGAMPGASNTCPVYSAAAQYRDAIEVPQGDSRLTWASALAVRSSVGARAPPERGYAVGGSVNCWPWRETCSVQARPSQ